MAEPRSEQGAAGPDGDNDATWRGYIHDRFIDMWLRQSRPSQLGQLFVAAVIAAVWYGRLHSPWALAWLAAVGALAAWRWVYTERLVRGQPEATATRRVIAMLAASGVAMAQPIWVFPDLHPFETAAISSMYLGLAAAAPSSSSGYRKVFLAYAIPMLLPLSFAWALAGERSGEPAGLLMAVAVLLLLGYLIGLSGRIHEVFLEASRFRHGEQRLNRALQRALERADESSRAKTHFLAAASHDLRQPIHGITVLVGALSLRPLDPRTREIVDSLDAVNQVLSRQLESLLDVSKLDAGVIRPRLGTHDLGSLVRSHGEATQPVADERGVRLVVGPIDAATVVTDPALLTRVLGNLTDNALKFTPAEGTVTISVARRDGRAWLRVADTGIGIPADEQEKVFREFYQISNPGRDRAKGLGLGLSIVARLCALLQAEVSLQSAPGAGTAITVALPLADAGAPGGAGRARQAPLLAAGRTVLVVDDEDLVRDSMTLLLDELGCTVHAAADARAALAIARSRPIDLVLCDFRLGGDADGLDVIREIRAIHPPVHAVLVTGDTAPERIRRAQASGVPMLHKPVTLAQLRETLDALAAGRSLEDRR